MNTVVVGGALWVLGVSLAQLILVVSAAHEMRVRRIRDRFRRWDAGLDPVFSPLVTVVMPAHNEASTIEESVAGLLGLTYQRLEVIVVNDGSSDDTVERLGQRFDLVPVSGPLERQLPHRDITARYRSASEHRLWVIDKGHGGKADALNAGINMASGSLLCAVDADTLVEPTALGRLVELFHDDPALVAAGGTVRLVNESVVRRGQIRTVIAPRRLLPGVQTIEYIRSFLVGRLGWNGLGGNLIISGAFGLFRRDAVIAVGGYRCDTVGEDMELVVRLRRHGYEMGVPAGVSFFPEPVAWTEAPMTWDAMRRQRSRWHRGLLEVLWTHGSMMGRRRYRAAGLIGLPYYVIVECLSPVIETLGLFVLISSILLGWLPVGALWPLTAAYGAGATVSALALWLDDRVERRYRGIRSRIRLLTYVIVEQILYRPVTMWWRLIGVAQFLARRRDWGVQARHGFRV